MTYLIVFGIGFFSGYTLGLIMWALALRRAR